MLRGIWTRLVERKTLVGFNLTLIGASVFGSALHEQVSDARATVALAGFLVAVYGALLWEDN